jgi:hypothetical protein
LGSNPELRLQQAASNRLRTSRRRREKEKSKEVSIIYIYVYPNVVVA